MPVWFLHPDIEKIGVEEVVDVHTSEAKVSAAKKSLGESVFDRYLRIEGIPIIGFASLQIFANLYITSLNGSFNE